jgi:MFS family permease
MDMKKLARVLQLALIGAAVLGAAVFFWAVPMLGQEIAVMNPEYAVAYWPWQIFLWLCAVPCFLSLVPGWHVFGRLANKNAFCRENGEDMKTIARLAFFDTILFVVGNAVMAGFGWHHPGYMLMALVICGCGALIGVVAQVLGMLVLEATAMREENDLTI